MACRKNAEKSAMKLREIEKIKIECARKFSLVSSCTLHHVECVERFRRPYCYNYT